ncbi:cobyrinate a,c-diamide synthase [Pseudovibrio sp. SPO723]|uniref:cobyrinate a,c-diamide synthase n=1 Tax=Nesiotobacter zosterae TaxID=392721 RepID=UPI0029C30888|nr:cobyrinate a,c-diamide synthase [Pseudovibrio sp. SPO723]MDX5592231.1 cobyrinate a,c-diamide synthase [Pseudovibrio sp. SPO723]
MTIARGFVVAAPSSGAGKTTITLALLRAFRDRGVSVVSAKSGPDYIDPAFHSAASGAECINLDAWGMTPVRISSLVAQHTHGKELLIVEAAMGLFDGAADDTGSAADLAAQLGLPVVLVVDCAKQAQSVAALVHGFCTFRKSPKIAGVILNRVGSPRHATLLRRALQINSVPVLGVVYRDAEIKLEDRHLGLVQAQERTDLEDFLVAAGRVAEEQMDLSVLQRIGRPLCIPEQEHKKASVSNKLAPLGQRIAVAHDLAFAFSYPHMLQDWQDLGAEIQLFSPLNNEGPAANADAVFLPGGYPELHLETLSQAAEFKAKMTAAKDRNALIYGECGGYMVLGDAVTGADGISHPMLGFLPLETSFAERKLHLGYRRLHLLPAADALMPWKTHLSAHEFHYATILREGEAAPLFSSADSERHPLGNIGLVRNRVAGSFAHVISERGADW